jgi:hypothetical protein
MGLLIFLAAVLVLAPLAPALGRLLHAALEAIAVLVAAGLVVVVLAVVVAVVALHGL